MTKFKKSPNCFYYLKCVRAYMYTRIILYHLQAICGTMFYAYAHGISDKLQYSPNAVWTASASLTSKDGNHVVSSHVPGSKIMCSHVVFDIWMRFESISYMHHRLCLTITAFVSSREQGHAYYNDTCLPHLCIQWQHFTPPTTIILDVL